MRLVVGSAPHIRHDDNITVMMGDMLVALVPMVVMSYVYYGVRALLLTLISVVSCIAFEYVYTRVYRKRSTIGDLSAVVTGVILACNLPASVPLWFPVAGAAFAILVCKQLFGGLGRNLFNPALAAVVFLTVTWSGTMSTFSLPFRQSGTLDVDKAYTTDMTVLSALHQGVVPQVSLNEMLWGNRAGALGTCAVVVMLIAALYLLYRRLINWQLPVSFLGTVAVLALIFPRCPSGNRIESMLYELMGGSLLFVAFFMATDPATSPISSFGRVLYGVLCGAFTVLLRYLGVFPEGAYFALLLVNPISMSLDDFTRYLKRRLGRVQPAQAEGGLPDAES